MRSKEELGQLLLDNRHLFYTGLCLWIGMLVVNDKISSEEGSFLFSTMNSASIPEGSYKWTSGDIEPRISFIEDVFMGIDNKKWKE